MTPPLIGGGIKRCFCLTSVCLSRTPQTLDRPAFFAAVADARLFVLAKLLVTSTNEDEVMFLRMFVRLFVSTITQKLLNR